jgi:hypothetical protein
MKKLVAQLVLCAALVVPSATSRVARAEKHPTNACGCYGEINACFCEKKAKCGCPGECEPKGCEEDRQKKLQKEIDEETKKARETEKAQQAEKKAKEEAAKAATSKTEDDDDDSAASDKDSKGKKPGKKLTSAQKKQLKKLIDALLAAQPDAGQRSLSEIRKDL